MRIVIVTHFFWPERGAPQARLSDFAKVWTQLGHEIQVLTGIPNHPTGIVPDTYKGRWALTEQHPDGYTVTRTPALITSSQNPATKSIGHLTFAGSAALRGLVLGRPDIVLASTPTLYSVGGALAIAKRYGAPMVLEVRDLWPASMIALGALKPGALHRGLVELEEFFYRSAAGLVGVTEGICTDISHRMNRPVRLFTNGVFAEQFDAYNVSGLLPAETFRKDLVEVVYLGAHGKSHSLDTVLDAAAMTKNPAIRYTLVGDGSERSRLVQRAEAEKLHNVRFLPAIERSLVPSFLAGADICLVTLRDLPLFQGAIPSKALEFLAASKAVIGSVPIDGEMERILKTVGMPTVKPSSPEPLRAAVENLANDASERLRLGREAREFVKANYSRQQIAERYLEYLAEVAA